MYYLFFLHQLKSLYIFCMIVVLLIHGNKELLKKRMIIRLLHRVEVHIVSKEVNGDTRKHKTEETDSIGVLFE